MRLYFEIARRGFRRYAAYPGATFAGLFTNTFFGFLIAYVFLAVFRERDQVGGYSAPDTVTYVWLAQALLSVVASFGASWQELALRVRSGDVVTDLRRPVDVQMGLLAEDAGRALHQLFFRAVPPFLVGALAFDLVAPDEVTRWLLFAVSVSLAVVVSFGVRFLVNLSAFWLLDYRGPMMLAMVVSHLFSGLIVPLVFLPDGLEAVARALPFASMLQTPIDVFLGELAGARLAGALALQCVWAASLLLAGRAVLAAGTRKLVIQGG